MRILVGLSKQIRIWDTPSKTALGIAVTMLAGVLVVLATVPDLQTPALLGGGGLFIAIQVIVLWGNRSMVTPYTQAQRHFMAGDFEAVVEVLRTYVDEQDALGKRPTIDSLVLLGNTYRTLGQLRESESILRVAVARQPHYHFALYGLGKTLLAKGEYDKAIETIRAAHRQGTPAVVLFDVGLAHFLGNEYATAAEILVSISESLIEPYRQLMAAHALYAMQPNGNFPLPNVALIETGLPFWEAEIARFSQTPYGQGLQRVVADIRSL